MLWTLWGLGRDNVAPAWACTFLVLYGHCPMMGQSCMYIMYRLSIGLDMYVLYCPQWALMYGIISL